MFFFSAWILGTLLMLLSDGLLPSAFCFGTLKLWLGSRRDIWPAKIEFGYANVDGLTETHVTSDLQTAYKLPTRIRTSTTLSSFLSRLKTHLYTTSFAVP